MMKYQLEYDKCLFSGEEIDYQEKKEYLVGISLWVRFSDIFITSEILQEQGVSINGEMLYLGSLVTVSYNSKTKEFTFLKNPDYKGTYEIVGYHKTVTPEKGFAVLDDVAITKEEFEFILSKYGELFDDDSSLQNLAYGTHTVEE
ncbi:hypothetical protein [Pediococcus pentosaceus]|uniref:hypothetical protein n=1 Tax=Pediococcus pentosaceus TaxID=1255 RepID=UPI0013637AFC|nr:hypothetical protein [Pediococcus pentosaceus]QHM67922.1 hypothetical protein C7M49_01890 [Pediococcus pentosaceus]